MTPTASPYSLATGQSGLGLKAPSSAFSIGTQRESYALQGVGAWSTQDYVNGSDIQSDQAYEARRQQESIASSDAVLQRRLNDIAQDRGDRMLTAMRDKDIDTAAAQARERALRLQATQTPALLTPEGAAARYGSYGGRSKSYAELGGPFSTPGVLSACPRHSLRVLRRPNSKKSPFFWGLEGSKFDGAGLLRRFE